MNRLLLCIVMLVASFGGVPCYMEAAAELNRLENSLYQIVKHVKKPVEIAEKRMRVLFKESIAVKALVENSYRTNIFYRFRSNRLAEIYCLKKDMLEYGVREGDFFYQDMGHGDQLEVFKADFKPRTVLRLKDGSVDIRAYKQAEKYKRTLFTTPYSPFKEGSPVYMDKAFNALNFGDTLRQKSRKTNLVYNMAGMNLELYIVEGKSAKAKGAKKEDVVIGSTTLRSGNLFFIAKDRIEVFDNKGVFLFDLNAQGKEVAPIQLHYKSLFVEHESTKTSPINTPHGATQPQQSGFVAWFKSWWPRNTQAKGIITA